MAPNDEMEFRYFGSDTKQKDDIDDKIRFKCACELNGEYSIDWEFCLCLDQEDILQEV